MPMPNRQMVGGELYRYSFQGQEKDPETGKEAFQLRLWDSRIGRWLTTDPAGEFKSPYIGMGNMPTVAIDPDGGDIIILADTKAVGGLGHSAVLIGNDIDGWQYYSKNGTEEGYFFDREGGKLYGVNFEPDLGKKIYKGATVVDVIRQVNNFSKEKHHYDKYIRITTTTEEDNKAKIAAYNEANTEKYGVCGTSCVDVPQEALNATGKRFKRGFLSKLANFGDIFPNEWFKDFGWYNNFGSYNIVPKQNFTVISGKATEVGIEY